MTAEDAETTQENQQMDIETEILHTRYAGEVYITPVILVLGLFSISERWRETVRKNDRHMDTKCDLSDPSSSVVL